MSRLEEEVEVGGNYELGRIAGLREAASMILAQGRDLVNKREMSNVLNRLAGKLETGEAK